MLPWEKVNSTKRYPMIKGVIQLNFGGIVVELRIKERRIEGIEKGIHVHQAVR